MVFINKENKIAFVSCIEIALMRRGNTNYNLVLTKLKAQFGCKIDDCLDHPEYLKTVMKQVYKYDYNIALDEISLETDKLNEIDDFKADFFKFMMS